MKKALFTALVLVLALAASAQETNEVKKSWTHHGNIGLNFGQSAFANWSVGGQSSLNWQGIFNYELHYQKNSLQWDNTLNASLGYLFYSFKKGVKPIKTDDKLEFTSLLGVKATEKLYYSAELAFRSQFAKGYDYEKDSTHYISRFLAPAYISLGIGIDWVPNPYFSLNFAPLTGRLTIVRDTTLAESFGFTPHLDPNDDEHLIFSQTRMEFGARVVAKFQYPFTENILFNSKLELFSNYLKNPQYIDVDWQNLLVLKVNSWLNASLATHLIYDYDIPFYDAVTGEKIKGSKVQFKEVLSIGFMINLK